MKRVLILSSVASMISQFNQSNIKILQNLGYEVDIACNFYKGNTCNQQEIEELKNRLGEDGISCFQINFSRNITAFRQNIKAWFQVKKLLSKRKYSFVHCHSPIGGIVGRTAGFYTKTKVIYTAHGFHFYKGASAKNWILFYPVEWVCSWMTDILITINKEDCYFAEKHLHANKVEYVPGIGIDIKQYTRAESEKNIGIRKELGLNDSTKILLSVGELNHNKNHEVVIAALSQMREHDFIYLICGQGELEKYLKKLITNYVLEEKVKLLGYRNDMKQIYQAADIFIFPSIREGLSVALMESMASGLPVVCSKIRGNTDLITDGEGGFLIENPKYAKSFSEKIKKIIGDPKFTEAAGNKNQDIIKQFSSENTSEKMKRIYSSYNN